jgi:hypothetical protein
MRTRLLLFSLALAPSFAAAQITVTETTSDSTGFVNIAECNNATPDGLTFTWTFPGFVAGGSYLLQASDTVNCPTASTTVVAVTTTVGTVAASSATGSFPLTGNTAVNTLLQQLSIPCNSAKTAVFFCVTLSSVGGTSATPVTGTLTLDLAPPPAPVATTADPGDSALNVNWTAGSGSTADAGASGSAVGFSITATNAADPADTHTTDEITGSGITSGRIAGLQNNVLYNVTVQAFSPGGNVSGPSNTIQGTPVAVNDFWRLYRGDGGREGGGCAAGAAGMLALLAVPLALRAWRRRS